MSVQRRSTEDLLATQTVREGECWNFTGGLDRDGYGRAFLNGKQGRAHRIVYEALVGPIPKGLVIDHLCRNRRCVNPDHMETVTIAENVRRGDNVVALNPTKTHCPQGHPYSGENLYYDPRGWRGCKACRNAKR